MDYSKTLPLQIKRDLGDIIGDGFKIIIKNISAILMAWLVYVLPVLIIPMVILSMTGLYSDLVNFDMMGSEGLSAFITSLGLMSIGTMLAYFMGNLVVYSVFYAYQENGNQKVTFEEISRNVRRFFSNYLVSTLIVGGILLVSYGVVIGAILASPAFGAFVMFIFFFVAIWFVINIQFYAFIRIREGLSVQEGWFKAFYLVKDNWWNTFGVLIIASIVAAVLMYAIVIPVSMISAFSSFSSVEAGNEMQSAGTMMVVVSTITSIVALFFQQYVTACKVLKYYDLSNKKDRGDLFDEIDKLGSDSGSVFENEGEF